jgi:hypothetical protein
MNISHRERLGILAIAFLALAITGAGIFFAGRQPEPVATPQDIQVLLDGDSLRPNGEKAAEGGRDRSEKGERRDKRRGLKEKSKRDSLKTRSNSGGGERPSPLDRQLN